MARRSPKINRWTKDPVLDEVLDLLHKSPLSWAAIARESGVSVSTLRSWDVGKTQRPQNMSLFLVLRALGYSRKIVKD